MNWRKRITSAAPLLALAAIAGAYFVIQYSNSEPEVPLAPVAPPPVVAPLEPLPALATTPLEHWSFYHGGSNLAGYAESALPAQPSVRWRHQAEGAFTQPAVSDALGLYACTTDGQIVALAFDGTLRWSAEASERVDAPIACAFGLVLVPCLSGRLQAFDASSGELRWTFAIDGGELLGTPQAFAPADPAQPALIALVNRTGGEVYWLDPDSGEVRWQTGELSRTDSSPALADGILAFGSCDVALHFFPAKEGAARLDVPLGGDCQIASGPAIVDGLVYCGSRCGKFLCADLRTGQVRWINESCPDEIFTTPAVGPELVIFGAEDETVYALDRATGELRWQVEMPDVPSSPVLAGEHVFVSADGTLHLLNANTGELLWTHAISDAIASPSIIAGLVVITAGDGAIVAFGP